MKNSIWKSTLPVLFVLGCANFAHAGFIGREVSVEYAFPDLTTNYPQAISTPQSFLVTDPGIESVVNVEGVTTIAVDFTDQSLFIQFGTILTNPRWNDATFSGLLFTLISGGPFSLANGIVNQGSTTLGGFDASDISFSDTQIFLNWNGLSYGNGTTLRIDFEFARDVPEPATLGLLGIGLVGVVAQRRRSNANKRA